MINGWHARQLWQGTHVDRFGTTGSEHKFLIWYGLHRSGLTELSPSPLKDGALWAWQVPFKGNSAENQIFTSVTDPNKTLASAVANCVRGSRDHIHPWFMSSEDSYLADGRKGHFFLTGMEMPYELQQKIFSRYTSVMNQFHTNEHLLV